MTTPITCGLNILSDGRHLQQLYTGFRLLANAGVVRLSQRMGPRASGHGPAHLPVTVNGKLRLFYDLHDGPGIAEAELDAADAYFKRSYAPRSLRHLERRDRVHPLGLNCPVHPNGMDSAALRRTTMHRGGERIRAALRALGLDWLPGGYAPRLHALEHPPDFDLPPRVLYMTQAWDPEETERGGRKEERQRIEAMNESRALWIRTLRNAFGAQFLGGFAHTDYAGRYFPDCLLPEPTLAKQSRYLTLLASFPVCVASRGLHDSIGWKMAEYVAHSRAIVSEPLAYEVPGSFRAGENYLAFGGPDALVAAVERLFRDRSLRVRMMTANHRYYRDFVRPDALVLNSLRVALGAST